VDGEEAHHISCNHRGASSLARKPNYRFERSERQRTKAQKKAAKLEKRVERKSAQKDENQDDEGAVVEQVDSTADSTNSD